MSAESNALFQFMGGAAEAVTEDPETPWPVHLQHCAMGRAAFKAMLLHLAPEIARATPPARACEDACPLFRRACEHSRECLAGLGLERDPQCGVGMEPGPDCPMSKEVPSASSASSGSASSAVKAMEPRP